MQHNGNGSGNGSGTGGGAGGGGGNNGNGNGGKGSGGNGATGGQAEVTALLQGAAASGTLSAQTSSWLTGHLGKVVVAGAAGAAMEDIVATDVTLMTLLIDASSSIEARGLEQAVRDGQGMLVDSVQGSKQRDSILMALWTFNHELDVLHSYLQVSDAVRLDAKSYRGTGSTRLYDAWCDALASNVAYAQRLRDSGTSTRSIVVVITDGEDTGSSRTAADCAKLSKDLLASEQFVLGFVGVGKEVDFRAVARSMGVPEGGIAVQAQATPSALRKVFQMVSQSAIRASQARIQPGGATGFFGP